MELLAATDNVMSLCPPRHTWCFKVRVIHMWTGPAEYETESPSKLDMVFMDQDGGKIQASLGKGMIRKWGSIFVEGNVYLIRFCHLLPNVGLCRATEHPYRVLFSGKTTVVPVEGDLIPRWGLSLKTTEQVHAADVKPQYLVDMIGLLISVSPERTYVKDGRVTNLMMMELSDDKGKVSVAAFGDCISKVINYLNNHPNEKPVLVVQLAKIKTCIGDKNMLQLLVNTSRICFNPDIAEVISFKNKILDNGIKIDEPVCEFSYENACPPMIVGEGKIHSSENIGSMSENTGDFKGVPYTPPIDQLLVKKEIFGCMEEKCDLVSKIGGFDANDLMEAYKTSSFFQSKCLSKFSGGPSTEKFDEVDDVLVHFNNTDGGSETSSKSLKRKLENEFEAKDGGLKVKNDEVKKLENEFEDKDGGLKVKNDEVKKLENEFEDQDGGLKGKNDEVKKLENEFEDEDGGLKVKNDEVKNEKM